MIWKKILLTVWIVGAFYFSYAGIYVQNLNKIKVELSSDASKEYIYDGISFSSPELIEIYKDKKKYNKIFGWYESSVPESLLLILSTMFISSIGVSFNLVYKVVINRLSEKTNFTFHLLFGLLIGFLVWLLLYILPTILYENETKINYNSLFLLAILCGVFYRKFYDKLGKIFEKLFKNVA